MRSSIIIFILVLISFENWAHCEKPSKFIKANKKEGWAESTQSRAGYLKFNETYEMVFIAQKDMEYLLSFGSNLKALNSQIDFLIYEKVVVKVEENGSKVYRKIDNVLYDSKKRNSPSEMTFVNRETRKLYLTISLPNPSSKNRNPCVGVLIEHKRALKLWLD